MGGWLGRVGSTGGSLPARVVVDAHPTLLPGEWGEDQPPIEYDAKREKPLVSTDPDRIRAVVHGCFLVLIRCWQSFFLSLGGSIRTR